MSDRAASPELRAFAMRLSAARLVHGGTRTRLANQLGVSLQRYHSWEQAKATPNSFELYAQLGRHLTVTTDWLIFGDEQGMSIEMTAKLGHALALVTPYYQETEQGP